MNIYEKLSPIAKLSKEEIKMNAKKSPEYKPNRRIAYKAVSFATVAVVLAGTGFGINKIIQNKQPEKLAPGYTDSGSNTDINKTLSENVNIQCLNSNGNTAYDGFETTAWTFTDGLGDIEFQPEYAVCENYEIYQEYFTKLTEQLNPDDEETQKFMMDYANSVTLASPEEFENNVLYLFIKDTYDTDYNLQSLVIGNGQNHFFFKGTATSSPVSGEEGKEASIISFVQVPRAFFENTLADTAGEVRYLSADDSLSYDRITVGTPCDGVLEIMGEPKFGQELSDMSYSYVLALGDIVTYYFNDDENKTVNSYTINEEKKIEEIPYEESPASQIQLGMTEEEVAEILGRDVNAENYGADKFIPTMGVYNYELGNGNSVGVYFEETGVIAVLYNSEFVLGEVNRKMFTLVPTEYGYDPEIPVPTGSDGKVHEGFYIDYAGTSECIGKGAENGTANPYIIFHNNDMATLFIYQMTDADTEQVDDIRSIGSGKMLFAFDLIESLGELNENNVFKSYFINVSNDGSIMTIATEPGAEYKYVFDLNNLENKDTLSGIRQKYSIEKSNTWGRLSNISEDYSDVDIEMGEYNSHMISTYTYNSIDINYGAYLALINDDDDIFTLGDLIFKEYYDDNKKSRTWGLFDEYIPGELLGTNSDLPDAFSMEDVIEKHTEAMQQMEETSETTTNSSKYTQ